MNKQTSDYLNHAKNSFRCRTDFNPPSCESVRSSPPIRKIYERKASLVGRGELFVSGEENTYRRVQEAAKGHTLPELFSRFQRGDLSAIPQPEVTEELSDFTELPTSAMEASNRIAQATQYFERLPSEVRQEYNNDARLYLAALSDGTIFKKAEEAKRLEKELSEARAAAQAAQPLFSEAQLKSLDERYGLKK